MKSEHLGIFLRGMAMGAADIVPGVSGGTIAFISGIYERLVDALGAFTPNNALLLTKGRFAAFWRAVDGSFLCILLIGILTSVFSLARVLSSMLEARPHLVWAFFAGLVIASAVFLGRGVVAWRPPGVVAFVCGLAIASLIVRLPGAALPEGSIGVFFAGSIAICAMVLPGISGSFILLLLGKYAPTLAAVNSLDFSYLAAFACGCAAGLLAFTQLLRWLLHHYHGNTLMLLTGFLVGSLPMLWPWQQPGGTVGLHPVLPQDYAAVADLPPQILLCLIALLSGAMLVWIITAVSARD